MIAPKRQGLNRGEVAYSSFAPGEGAPDLRTADFILTHRGDFSAKCIRFGERLRFHGKDSVYAYWNHAAFVCNSNGDLIESLTSGVTRSKISKYFHTEYTIVRLNDMSDADRNQCLKFAEWCVGQKYGWFTIINCVLWSFFGGKFDFSMDGQEICSGLVARALERAGEIFVMNPSRNTPAHLAKHFDVAIPNSPKGIKVKA